MATTKAQQKAVNKYIKNNYDSLRIIVPKGRKSDIQAAAAAAGESINSYVIRATLERMGATAWEDVGKLNSTDNTIY